jgi:hypothetical protein
MSRQPASLEGQVFHRKVSVRVGLLRAAPGTVGVDRSRTKVAHRVEGVKVIGAPRKGAGVGQLRASEDSWRRRAI